VYACRIRGDLGIRDAVVNIGTRPTFGGQDRRVEAFLFDFNGDLYGRDLAVRFVAGIREERTFVGVEDLRRQIEADAAAARVLLGG
jgi:riboflavin kinase/FMN adenylyltransferase